MHPTLLTRPPSKSGDEFCVKKSTRHLYLIQLSSKKEVRSPSKKEKRSWRHSISRTKELRLEWGDISESIDDVSQRTRTGACRTTHILSSPADCTILFPRLAVWLKWPRYDWHTSLIPTFRCLQKHHSLSFRSETASISPSRDKKHYAVHNAIIETRVWFLYSETYKNTIP